MAGFAAAVPYIAMGVSQYLQSLGANSQDQANRMNYDIFRRQNAFAHYQYEDMKKYNSMVEQVKRMRAAGLNPAFMNGALGAGMATGVSQPSANPQQPLDLNGLSSFARNISDFSQAALQNLNTEAQTQNVESMTKKNEIESAGLQVDNLFRRANWASIIGNRNTETFLKRQLGEVAKLDAQFNTESFKQRLLNLKYEGELKDAQIAAQDIINSFLPSLQSAEYNELVSRAVANYATGRASLQSAMAAVMNAQTERGKVSAQFGKDDKERSRYFGAVMDLMFEQRYSERAKQYNLGTTSNPLPRNGERWKDFYSYLYGTKRW